MPLISAQIKENVPDFLQSSQPMSRSIGVRLCYLELHLSKPKETVLTRCRWLQDCVSNMLRLQDIHINAIN